MKEHPMLFSTPMVQAILAGRKTQTRRLIKPQPSLQGVVEQFCKEGPGSVNSMDLTKADMEIDSLIEKCKWQVGDHIWVRETFYAYGWWIKEGRKWQFVDFTQQDKQGAYRFFNNPPAQIYQRAEKLMGWYKRPSLFMPKEAARIWLKVTDIRVEQLQDISEEDAIAEGITPLLASSAQLAYSGQLYRDYSKPAQLFNDGLKPVDSYRTLWESINGRESWEANPWVWVVSFDVIGTTGRPDTIK